MEIADFASLDYCYPGAQIITNYTWAEAAGLAVPVRAGLPTRTVPATITHRTLIRPFQARLVGVEPSGTWHLALALGAVFARIAGPALGAVPGGSSFSVPRVAEEARRAVASRLRQTCGER